MIGTCRVFKTGVGPRLSLSGGQKDGGRAQIGRGKRVRAGGVLGSGSAGSGDLGAGNGLHGRVLGQAGLQMVGDGELVDGRSGGSGSGGGGGGGCSSGSNLSDGNVCHVVNGFRARGTQDGAHGVVNAGREGACHAGEGEAVGEVDDGAAVCCGRDNLEEAAGDEEGSELEEALQERKTDKALLTSRWSHQLRRWAEW